jgi:hypothetical protein
MDNVQEGCYLNILSFAIFSPNYTLEYECCREISKTLPWNFNPRHFSEIFDFSG